MPGDPAKGTMIERFTHWLRSRRTPGKAPLRHTDTATGVHLNKPPKTAAQKTPGPARNVPREQPEFVELDPHFDGQVEDAGPGKNVLIRKKYVREDTGTHETLKILDDSMLESDDEAGLDPYNSGHFDRAKNWDRRFRK